jgi:putative ABC transport system substrate-binding protein
MQEGAFRRRPRPRATPIGGISILIGLLGAGAARAAEVALLKSTEAPAWRAAIEAFRRVAAGQAISEFDLRADRGEAERVVGALRGRSMILVAMGTLAAQVVRDLAPEAPIVFCMVQDPGRLNLLNLANAAGVTFTTPVKNQLAAFRLVYPRGVRIGVIFADEAAARMVQEAQKATSVVRVAIIPRQVASEKEIPETLRGLLRGNDAADALWIPPDPTLLGDQTRRFLLAETLKAGKPVFSSYAALVAEGALASSGPDYVSIGEMVGELVNRMAEGDAAARGALLVPRGELVINKKIAEKLRIQVSADALKAASRVY